MHRYYPPIRGFHPLPPPGHVRAAQEARYDMLGRLDMIRRILPHDESRSSLVRSINDTRMVILRLCDDARNTHGNRLAGNARPPHPSEIADMKRRGIVEPLDQAIALLDTRQEHMLDGRSKQYVAALARDLKDCKAQKKAEGSEPSHPMEETPNAES